MNGVGRRASGTAGGELAGLAADLVLLDEAGEFNEADVPLGTVVLTFFVLAWPVFTFLAVELRLVAAPIK